MAWDTFTFDQWDAFSFSEWDAFLFEAAATKTWLFRSQLPIIGGGLS